MSKVVVDTSLALKWVIVEEDSPRAMHLLEQWTKERVELLAPVLFLYEMTNIIYRQTLKSKSTYEEMSQGLENVFSIGISIRVSSLESLSKQAMKLAHEFNLSATYDAHYLALAQIEGCECWTADKRLWNAVKDKLSWLRLLDNYIP